MWCILFTLLVLWVENIPCQCKTVLPGYLFRNMQDDDLCDLTVLLRSQRFSCFSNFRRNPCKNYWLYKKILQTKVVQNSISCKKLAGRLSFSPPEVKLEGGKHLHLLEWKSRFTFGLNAAKSTYCIEKCFKQKLYKIKFPTKNSVGASLYLPLEWS